jgi:2-iminoacetate synthase
VTKSFAKILSKLSPADLEREIEAVTPDQVGRLLERDRIRSQDVPLLFSPAAAEFLEQMSVRSAQVTRRRFGRTISIYAPLYLSNHCVNSCTYCGFAKERDIPRRRLSIEQACRQAEHLIEQGVRQLLLVTGEAKHIYGLDDLCRLAEQLRPRLAGLSVEVFPCQQDEYQRLIDNGVDGLVLYQETYDAQSYSKLHPYGPKRDFDKRLGAIEAGGRAGFRTLGIGSLLGLTPASVEICFLAWHCEFLTRQFPESRLAVSFPRLRPVAGGAPLKHPLSGRQLAQYVVGMRLLFPDAELVISTRESAGLRDRLLHFGVTRISAGSRTSPGAYGQEIQTEEGQFETDDCRSVDEVSLAIRQAGYDPVFKDFDPAFMSNRGNQ